VQGAIHGTGGLPSPATTCATATERQLERGLTFDGTATAQVRTNQPISGTVPAAAVVAQSVPERAEVPAEPVDEDPSRRSSRAERDELGFAFESPGALSLWQDFQQRHAVACASNSGLWAEFEGCTDPQRSSEILHHVLRHGADASQRRELWPLAAQAAFPDVWERTSRVRPRPTRSANFAF
jgi:hypothetical protein